MSDFFVMKPCQKATAFEVVPQKQMSVDFDSLGKVFETVIRIEGMMILNIQGVQATVYPRGKILIRTTDRDKAEQAVNSIYEIAVKEGWFKEDSTRGSGQ
ncbi:MAG: hypothetical protein J4432_04180 [DPANN group archaeon]|nr:hypothetical protein [DPANN group archaeon]